MFPQSSNEPTEPQAQPTPASTDSTLPSVAASTQPTAPTTSGNASTTASPASGSSKKKWIILGSVLGVVLVGGVASAMWWTSPEKSLSDAMSMNSIPKGGNIKGDIVVTPKDSNAVTITFDSKYKGMVSKTDLGVKMSMGAMKLDITGGVATTANKRVMFRVNDVRDTVKSLAQGYDDVVEQYYGKLIDKVDNKWVEVTESDLKDATKDSGIDLSCFMDKTTKLINDKAFMKEAADIYSKNAYFSIKDKVGSEKVDGRDSNHIVLAYDKTKAKAYGEALEKTNGLKDLKSCVKDADKDPTSSVTDDSAATPKIELWVDKWSHKVNKIVVSQDQDGTSTKLTATIGYNDNQSVDVPKADTQFKDLKTEIDSLQQQFAPTTSSESLMLENI